MSKRRVLLRRTLLLCTIPVVIAGGWIAWKGSRSDAPYVAGHEEEGITRALERETGTSGHDIRFREVTEEAGIEFRHFPHRRTSQLPEDMGPGAAWGDFDGDGLDDLFLVDFAAPLGVPDDEMESAGGGDRLYRNRGDGTFEDVTATAGVGVRHRGIGASWADHDGDGDLDLFVTSWGENLLWRNRGDGTFEEVAALAGLSGPGFWTGAAWADPDLDGDLDLYLCGYVDYTPVSPAELAEVRGVSDFPFTLNPSSWPAHPNRFFRNRGDGTFEDATSESGLANEGGKTLCAAWGDFDEDGWPDLYVANDVSDNAMFRNRGDGTFEDVSYAAVVADYRGAMGVAVGDWDGDLDLDLFITHWIAQENALYSNQRVESGQPPGAPLLFVDDADRVGLGQIALDLIGWGTAFADVDADGLLDLFVANGSTFQQVDDPTKLVPMGSHLYHNRGPAEGFFEVAASSGLHAEEPGVERGAAFADYDLDGDPDLLVCRHGGPVRLLRNDTSGGHTIGLRIGGIGVRVVVHAGGRSFLREVGAGASYLSQSTRDLLVGVGEATRADSLVVTWPGGRKDVHRDLAVDRLWSVTAGNPPEVAATYRKESDPELAARASTSLSREEIRRFWELKHTGDHQLIAGDWSAATGTLEALVALDPRHEDSLYGLGNCHLELGRWAEAKAAWDELLAVNPASTRAWIQIGVLHTLPEASDLFDLEAAARAFERAHELNREESGPLILWGEVEVARGELEAARRLLDDARGMNDQSASAWYLSAYLAWKRDEIETARTYFEHALRSVEARAPVHGVAGEGDTRSAHMTDERRRTASRRLFADCLASLESSEGPPPLEDALQRIDDVRGELFPG